MTRETGIAAYNEIKEKKLLGAMQYHVYQKIFHHGPMTQGEVWKLHSDGFLQHDITPRFAELRDQGLLVEAGKRPCRVTGRHCIVWDVTSNLPSKPERKETKNQTIKRLESRVKELERKVFELSCDKNGNGLLF